MNAVPTFHWAAQRGFLVSWSGTEFARIDGLQSCLSHEDAMGLAFAVGFYDEVRAKLVESRQIETVNADADEFLSELAVQAGMS